MVSSLLVKHSATRQAIRSGCFLVCVLTTRMPMSKILLSAGNLGVWISYLVYSLGVVGSLRSLSWGWWGWDRAMTTTAAPAARTTSTVIGVSSARTPRPVNNGEGDNKSVPDLENIPCATSAGLGPEPLKRARTLSVPFEFEESVSVNDKCLFTGVAGTQLGVYLFF